jgi:hypothetical protein
VLTLVVMARRGASHTLVSDWTFQPDSVSPRRLELRLDDDQYPAAVEPTGLDDSHHLGVLFEVLDWATEGLSTLHED